MTETLEKLAYEVKFQTPGAGELTGMAAVYGNTDSVQDVIRAGAFAETLAQIKADGRELPMLLNHDPSRVIGKWVKLSDSTDGLRAHGKFTIDADEGRNAHALAKDGALTGLSIGYRVKASENTAGGGRLLTELELVEISLVTFPANDRARVTETKADKAATMEAEQMALDNASELDAKLTVTKGALDKALDRIADLEAKAKADLVPAKAKAETPIEVTAFDAYARKGERGMSDVETKALQNAVDAQGGALVPEDFRTELLR